MRRKRRRYENFCCRGRCVGHGACDAVGGERTRGDALDAERGKGTGDRRHAAEPGAGGRDAPGGHPGDGGAGRGGGRRAGALRGAELCAARDGPGHCAVSPFRGRLSICDEGHRAQHKCAHDGDHRGIRRDGAADRCALWPDACRRSLTPNGNGVCAVEPRSGGGQARPRRVHE